PHGSARHEAYRRTQRHAERAEPPPLGVHELPAGILLEHRPDELDPLLRLADAALDLVEIALEVLVGDGEGDVSFPIDELEERADLVGRAHEDEPAALRIEVGGVLAQDAD